MGMIQSPWANSVASSAELAACSNLYNLMEIQFIVAGLMLPA